jgi:hypothetical protein
MATGYSRSPKLLKGAIIQFSAPLLVPIPNIIVFQYNPETLARSFTTWSPPARDEAGQVVDQATESSLAQPYDPRETINLTLELDAADALEEPGSHPVAVLAGVADRLAALEMLLYAPEEDSLLGISVDVSIGAGGISASASATVEAVPRKEVPVVLFFWGPGRIVPVRITSFAVDEQAFSPTLYPIRAKVTVGMKILDETAFAGQDDDAVTKIAKACYTFTKTQKQVLATANLANSVESIMGMLPF